MIHGSTPAIQAAAGEWADAGELIEILTLANYNTRMVVLSTTLLGAAAGLAGTFLLLRKRSLMGDTLAHACLPGIALAFLVMTATGLEGKNLAGLLGGAALSGLAGVGLVLLIRNSSRIKDDAAMGIVLSVFFGVGAALMGLIQTMPGARAAGLMSFIYGKTAAMGMQDFVVICLTAGAAAILAAALTKELTVLCFDEGFARAQGWPIHALDLIMLGLVAAVTVVGLQAVGLILIIAFLIIPSAAARFWTDDLRGMLLLSAAIGAAGGCLGAMSSATAPDLPAGAMIVLTAAGLFLLSMTFGSSRGLLRQAHRLRKLRVRIGRQHLLRAVFEILESRRHPETLELANRRIDVEELLQRRSWTRRRLMRQIARARREDHVAYFDGRSLGLSEAGFGEAARITRNHRLWEMYLIRHADVAPAHVDRDADAVEHVLGPQMVRVLEAELIRDGRLSAVPPSTHAI
jgi:manganese/zinc/iron transport system permease protein